MNDEPPHQKIINDFVKKLSASEKRILLLDYDGTLAPFTKNRDSAFPYEWVPDLITQIMQNPQNKVAIISGRGAMKVKELLGLNKNPEIWGSHGYEWLDEKNILRTERVDRNTELALRDAAKWSREILNLNDNLEVKPFGIAIHWRGEDKNSREILESQATRGLQQYCFETSLELVPFDGGVELKTTEFNKGNAVRKILDMFNNIEYAAAYLGDDLTDEDAFKAIKDKGAAILVKDKWRKTHADALLKPPEELRKFLERWR